MVFNNSMEQKRKPISFLLYLFSTLFSYNGYCVKFVIFGYLFTVAFYIVHIIGIGAQNNIRGVNNFFLDGLEGLGEGGLN